MSNKKINFNVVKVEQQQYQEEVHRWKQNANQDMDEHAPLAEKNE